ncbi:hypothetical protein EQZ23_18560 [Sphingomonas sp. UV9]|uniref:hypothetical protein n=1 Tax=Sphingomonas sp. UV9 TaxID=1851410 RepID=UPI000FFC353F|nr:hypothetical protein [Sphingomonas sp. UV9]RXD02149.1 hypothetical protein EQZ23_18560 [Sphingomonas sp. UV9]
MLYIIGTFTDALAATIDPDVHVIRTSGRSTENDGGAATYQRTTATLESNQQNYSWFEAADGSVWQLASGQPYYAAQFGALGGDQIDSRPIIQAALDAPMVGVLNLGPLVHWFSGNIRKPSGKGLVGAGRAISGFRSFQITVQQASPRFGIYCDGDRNGWFADFFINIDRAGLNFGATPAAQLLNRCSGLVIRGDSRSVRVNRVDVYNATGYAHYTAAGDAANSGPTPKDIMRRDCQAYNSQVCFEATSLGTEEETVDCAAWGAPQDGGVTIPMEVAYHAYGGIARVIRRRCSFYGNATGDLTVITDGVDNGEVGFEDCDFETTGTQAGLSVANPDPNGSSVPANAGKITRNYWVRGGRIAGGTFGLLANNAKVRVDGTTFTSRSTGLQITANAAVDLYSPIIKVTGSTTIAVFGVNVEGTGTASWHGAGELTVTNAGTGAVVTFAPSVKFTNTPVITPPSSQLGTALPNYRQRKTGQITQTAWSSYNPTATNKKFYVNIPLATSVASRALTMVNLLLQQPDGSLVWPPQDLTITFNWQSNGLIQVQISTADALTNYSLRYEIVEYLG